MQIIPQPGAIINIRLQSFKSRRYYGGRDITTTQHICKAQYMLKQVDGTFLCKMLEPCAGLPTGHLISVYGKSFNI